VRVYDQFCIGEVLLIGPVIQVNNKRDNEQRSQKSQVDQYSVFLKIAVHSKKYKSDG
jgi:hypothetical protein